MALDLANLPPVHVQRGIDASYVADELTTAITLHMQRHPRSLQTAIGPSEIGHPCARRIGYKLLNTPCVNPHIPWKQTIGTAVHTWLENALNAENADTHSLRYLVEETVYVGDINGTPIFGHCDLYDRVTCGVVDWKIVGTTQLRNYKANGPGPQYRTQAHLYGRGWTLRGMPVDWVGIFFLPRTEELDRAVWWHEPYNEQVAVDALTRVNGIHLATKTLGQAALALLPTADAYCHRCDYYRHASTDPTQGCPGHPGHNMRQPGNPFPGILTTP